MQDEAEIPCCLCCSMHGYWHEAVPALQPGKSLRNAETVVHRLPGRSWKPRDYTPSRKSRPLIPAGKIWFIESFASWKYALQRIYWLFCRWSRRFDTWLVQSHHSPGKAALSSGSFHCTLSHSFTSLSPQGIVEVQGYVLVAQVSVSLMPLDNLRIIRGSQLYDSSYALAALDNTLDGHGLRTLRLRSLTGINTRPFIHSFLKSFGWWFY